MKIQIFWADSCIKPCDQLTLRRAELDEVKPTKYLCPIMGRTGLLEHSSLSNLILYFAIGLSPCHWCVPQSSLPTGVIQQLDYICPGDQSCCLGTDLHSQPVIIQIIHSQCARMMHKIQEWQSVTPINPTALLALITDMWHVSYKWQPLDSSGICTFRRQNVPEALSTAEHRQCIPQVAMPDFPPCYKTWYSQGVQPGRFLALLCLLAVQGGQELPSHPEIKERVRSFVHWWENVLKCTAECHMSTSGLDPAHRGADSARGSMGIWQSYCLIMEIKCPFSTTGAPAHLCGFSVCHVTLHNWVEIQSLQVCSFILVHCIKFPAFHRITKVGRDLQDQPVQPPAQHHLNHPKPHPQEPHPEHVQKQ